MKSKEIYIDQEEIIEDGEWSLIADEFSKGEEIIKCGIFYIKKNIRLQKYQKGNVIRLNEIVYSYLVYKSYKDGFLDCVLEEGELGQAILGMRQYITRYRRDKVKAKVMKKRDVLEMKEPGLKVARMKKEAAAIENLWGSKTRWVVDNTGNSNQF